MARKKKKHEHHGGAWKVAYADFVTAMMALFMVLWIMSQEEEVLIATARYFQNPFNSPLDRSAGVLSGTGLYPESQELGEAPPSSIVDRAFLHTLANEFYRHLNVDQQDPTRPVDIVVTDDGLRISVFDRNDRPIFQENSTELTDWGELVMQNLAWQLDRYPMGIRIDSHVARDPDREQDAFSLTVDRADRAREALTNYALDPDKLDRITGMGDNHPRRGTASTDPINDRLEISLQMEKAN